MMTTLLLDANCCGIFSSRRIARACRERVDFMSVVGLDAPDLPTISDFRKRHRKALSDLFKQVLLLCEQAGLVALGHVALVVQVHAGRDGSKFKANASRHKATSYGRMEAGAAELEAEVAEWMRAAVVLRTQSRDAADAAEDALHGTDRTGDEMPDWVADKQRFAEKIRQAKAELEAEARNKAEAEAEERRMANGRKKPGKPAAPPSGVPEAKAQKNFTDVESRIMPSKDGSVQAYVVPKARSAATRRWRSTPKRRSSSRPT